MGMKGKYRVLIVDDEADQRQLQTIILRNDGHYTVAADGAEAALAALKEDVFDVILLDKRMPEIDGDQLCKLIRKQPELALTPIIMVTGTTSNDELVASLDAGANDFIRKPYNKTEFLARICASANTKRLTDQLDNIETVLFALARMVEAKDENTGDHCTRLGIIADAFGGYLGLTDSDIQSLKRGGVLHDIGKLGIPDTVLLKRGRLDQDEWSVMRQHTVIGAHLCNGLRSMRDTLPIIRSHHEKWDGSGYPDGLVGDEIPYLARVFQVIDIFDALQNKRPYKSELSQGEVFSIMQEEIDKGWRDPVLMKQFFDFYQKNSRNIMDQYKEVFDPGARLFSTVQEQTARIMND